MCRETRTRNPDVAREGLKEFGRSVVANIPAVLVAAAVLWNRVGTLEERVKDQGDKQEAGISAQYEVRQNLELLKQSTSGMQDRLLALESRVGEQGELKYKFGTIAGELEKLERRMEFVETAGGTSLRK